MDMTAFVAVVAAILSGPLTAFFSYLLGRRRDETYFLRKKAEELYLAVDEYERNFGCLVLPYFPLARGKITFNELLDAQIKNSPKPIHGGFETVEMLVRIHFPELVAYLEAIIDLRSSFSELTGTFKEIYSETGAADPNWLPLLREYSKTTSRVFTTLKAAIIAVGHMHTPGAHVEATRIGWASFLRNWMKSASA